MLTKEVFPLFSKEMEHLLCDVNNVEECSTIQGKIGILKNDDAINGVIVPVSRGNCCRDWNHFVF